MSTLFPDTRLEAEAVLIRLLREAPSWRKLEMVSQMNAAVKMAFVATDEDIILAKLECYRLGGEISDRQWREILGVLKEQAGRLDLDVLQKWAAELKVVDLLQKALKESE